MFADIGDNLLSGNQRSSGEEVVPSDSVLSGGTCGVRESDATSHAMKRIPASLLNTEATQAETGEKELVRAFMLRLAVEMGKSPESIENFVQKLEDAWIMNVKQLKGTSQAQLEQLGIPEALSRLILEKIRDESLPEDDVVNQNQNLFEKSELLNPQALNDSDA